MSSIRPSFLSLTCVAACLAGCGGTATLDAGSDLGTGADLGSDAADGGSVVDTGPPVDSGPRCTPGTDAGPGDGYDAGTITRVADTTLGPMRDSCTFARGSFAAATVGSEYPVGAAIPIEHFVIFMQENRSFDSYFGTMAGVDGLPTGASNPDSTGTPVPAYHETHYCQLDLEHGWNAVHEQYNGGAMDGFVTSNASSGPGSRAMGYFDASDLPFYNDLYSRFSMSDRHFCSLLGPTWPNREYALAASSAGKIDNTPPSWPTDGSEYVIYQELDTAGVPWRVYYATIPYNYGFFPTYGFAHTANTRPMSHFMNDVACGDLPSVTWMDPEPTGGVTESDEHPPADPQYGEKFVHDAILALMQSPLWPTTAIILTYDEHGGYYDHVAPPAACPPGDRAPILATGDTVADFDRFGPRVPFVVISPFSKAHYVSHIPTDHSAILRLLEAKYGLPALTARDANAFPLLDMFDFAAPPFMTAPTDLMAAPIDMAHADQCHTDGF